MEVIARNICLFTGQLKSFRLMHVGPFKDIPWGYGVIFLPDPSNPIIGQEIRIQAWQDNALTVSELPYGTWIKISSVFCPSEFRGKEQSNFVIDTLEVINSGVD